MRREFANVTYEWLWGCRALFLRQEAIKNHTPCGMTCDFFPRSQCLELILSNAQVSPGF